METCTRALLLYVSFLFLLLDFNRQTGVYKPVNYQTDVWKDLRCLKLMKKLLIDLLTKYNCDCVIKPSYLLISINFCTFVSIAEWIKTRIKPTKCQYPAAHLSQGHRTCWTAHTLHDNFFLLLGSILHNFYTCSQIDSFSLPTCLITLSPKHIHKQDLVFSVKLHLGLDPWHLTLIPYPLSLTLVP